MRKSQFAIGCTALVCATLLASCRARKAPEAAPSRAEPAPAPVGDTNFTPPEIRRSEPSDSLLVPPATKMEATSAQPAAAPPAVPAAAPPSKPAPQPEPARVAAAKPVPPPPPPPPPAGEGSSGPGPEGDWVLQVNVHKSEAEAQAQVSKLAAAGIPAYSVAVPTEGGGLAGRYWRVRVGRFRSRADAQAYGESNVVPKGLKFWIDRKSNENRAVGGN